MKSGKLHYGNRTIISKQNKVNTLYITDNVSMEIMYAIDSKYDDRDEYKKNSADVMHIHSMYGVHIVKKGEVVYEFEDNNFITVKKNEFLIIPPSVKVRIEKESTDFNKIIIKFDINSLEDDRDGFYSTAIRMMKTPALYKNSGKMTKFINLIEEISKSSLHDKYNMIFNLLICYMMEICNIVVKKRDVHKNSVTADKRVLSAIKFIKDNISVPITASDVAKALYISPQHLSRLFKENMGVTTSRYIRSVKNEYISKLLIETDLSLSDIAELVGISDAASLIKRFKRAVNNTPKKYKQAILKDKK